VENVTVNEKILDYFAGSGTTAHATISLNREDDGKRKYILVEMGEYFESVLKPRIMKVVYSKDWKDGKPVSREGVSHMFKYMRLDGIPVLPSPGNSAIILPVNKASDVKSQLRIASTPPGRSFAFSISSNTFAVLFPPVKRR